MKRGCNRWWLQEGSTQIQHQWRNNRDHQEISHTSWLSDDEDAAPWCWPTSNAILVDNQSPALMCKGYAEKLMVSRVCCQVIQTCICETPPPWSCSVQNTLKQFCWALKRRIIHGIHRESPEEELPPEIHFASDSLMPHLIPTNTASSMIYTTPTNGPPTRIPCRFAVKGVSPWTPWDSNIPPPTAQRGTPEDLRLADSVWRASAIPTLVDHSATAPSPQQAFIKTPTGRTLYLDITDRDATIRVLKHRIWTTEGIPPSAYYLTANRKILEDETKLASISESPPHFITMVFRLLGGSQKNTAIDATNTPPYREKIIGLRTHLLCATRHHEHNEDVYRRETCNNQGKWESSSQGSSLTTLPYAILLWSTMCILLLMSLWTKLKWNGGHDIGINKIGNTNLAMNNCLWVSGMYSLVGVIATTLIVWPR